MGCERQLAAGDKIELPHLAPDLQHHGAKRIAGERIGRRFQRALDIESAYRDETTRIKAELGQSAHRQRARFEIAKILPHPDQRPPRHHASRKSCDETGCGCALVSLRKHLVHGSD